VAYGSIRQRALSELRQRRAAHAWQMPRVLTASATMLMEFVAPQSGQRSGGFVGGSLIWAAGIDQACASLFGVV